MTPATIFHDEVHLWQTALTADADAVERSALLLSTDEATRASRFVRQRDRERFIVARAALRRILGSYLGASPAGVSFGYGPHGKPELGPGQDPTLTFNLAHSGDLALCAVARGRLVGVDVERVAPDLEVLPIARRYFTEIEAEWLASLEGGACRRAFITLWTAKEAYAKALGGPLAAGLRAATVRLDAALAPSLSISGDDDQRWTLSLVEPAPDYLGAVVAEGRDWSLFRHTF